MAGTSAATLDSSHGPAARKVSSGGEGPLFPAKHNGLAYYSAA